MPRTGLIFLISIAMIFLMVAAGVGMIYLYSARFQPDRLPVIGVPVEQEPPPEAENAP